MKDQNQSVLFALQNALQDHQEDFCARSRKELGLACRMAAALRSTIAPPQNGLPCVRKQISCILQQR